MKFLASKLGWTALLIGVALLFVWYTQTHAGAGETIEVEMPTAEAPPPAPETAPPATTTPPPAVPAGELTGDIWTVVDAYDGDTMVVERGGIREEVRIIGIDTPEKGRCGADEARWQLEALIGEEVSLVPGAETLRDPYDRLLRYVEYPVDGADVGLELIEDGYAIARFDRRSNQPHDREDEYIAASDALAGDRICPDSAWDRGY